MQNTRILDSALSTFWAITEEGLRALKDLYFLALERGKVSDEVLTQVIRDNEELGHSLHLQSIDAITVRKAQPLSTERGSETRHTWLYENGVAVVDLIGPIYPRANMMTSSGATNLARFTDEYIRAYNDERVKGIVLNIDSPGGDVRGLGDSSKLMHRASAKNDKPIKAFASGYMASAAYYLGSIAQEVIGSESSIVGSIGTVLTAQAKDGNTIEIVSSQSPKKRPDPSTEEGVAVLQQQVDDLAEIFIKDVAKYRGVTRDKVLSDYGQGGVMVGPRAKAMGLLDRVSTLSTVVEQTASEARKGHSQSGYRQEAMEGSVLSVLEFREEDIMGLTDLVKKFKASKDTTLNDKEAQGATATQSDNATAPEGQTEGTIAPPAKPVAVVPTREELTAQFEDAAENFALKMTLGNHIYPAMQAHAASDLVNAKIDDTLFGGSIEFVNAEGEVVSGTREAAVRARYESMPKHSMTEQAVPAVKDGQIVAKVLAESDKETVKVDGPISEERKNELRGLTDLGQQVIAQSK